MNFSALSSNERLGAIGAAATIIGGAVAASSYRTWGTTWLGVIAAVAMLVVIFLPQMSAGTKLPGSKGSLMLIVGGIGGLIMAFMLLTTLGFTFTDFDASSVMFLIAVAGGLVMAWAGWQEFQAEGGKFNLGSSAPSTGPAAAPPPAAPPPAAPPPEPMSSSEPMGSSEDDDRT